MIRKTFQLIFFLLGLFLWVIGSARAQEKNPTPQPITDDQVNAIAREMYCPVCENTPLDVCPTQACAEWRELIRDKLAEGWSEKQIKIFFVERFGDRVLETPPARGLNWLVYLIPPLVFLAGVVLLIQAFRSMKVRSDGNRQMMETDPEPVEDPYMARLEDELRKL
jgi:cytochrome c-type biogenesis protein CcmH